MGKTEIYSHHRHSRSPRAANSVQIQLGAPMSLFCIEEKKIWKGISIYKMESNLPVSWYMRRRKWTNSRRT